MKCLALVFGFLDIAVGNSGRVMVFGCLFTVVSRSGASISFFIRGSEYPCFPALYSVIVVNFILLK